MDSVLNAWQQAGTDLIMLPSGIEVRLEPVPLAELVRTGFLPGQLRLVAMQVTPETAATMDPDEQARHETLERYMISRWLTAVRWTCPCPECSSRRPEPLEEQPYRLDPEVLASDPPPIPRIDLLALRDMVSYLRSPRQVDVLSRVAHGQMDVSEATSIVDAEQVNTLAGWASFRGQRSGTTPGPGSADLRRSAVTVPGPNRARRRAATRRSTRHPPVAGGPPPASSAGS